MYKKIKFHDGFLYAKGNMPIMLVAHIDTVHKQQVNYEDIYVNLFGDTITSPKGIGGDDRCGVYMIMSILKNTELRPYVLFCEDEEIGGIGSNKFVERYNANNLHLNYIIQLDRANSDDSVYYDLDNISFEDYINQYGFKTAFGSFTDICHLCPKLKCAGVNLSCGYYKQHTTSEYVKVDEMIATINKVITILENAQDSDYFEYKEYVYTKNYVSNLYKYDNYYYNDYYYNDRDEKYLDKKFKDELTNPYSCQSTKFRCDYCGKEYNYYNLNDDMYGSLICDDCVNFYHLHKCECCGAIMDEGHHHYCDDCASYYREENDKQC